MELQALYQCFLECKGVSTDTRKIEKEVMFFALKGDNFDGNLYAKKALEQGAKYVVIDNAAYKENAQYIVVDNVLETLQNLANYHRKQLKATIIALTGSNGKTTTKELIQVVLAKKYITKATVGNLNNHIGVPLTLLSFSKDTEMGIVEMGANHQKEIAFLCSIAAPDYGYITNFGKAHLEGFGGIEGVIKGKSEMIDYLQTTSKKVFVNGNDSLQLDKTKNVERIVFGSNDAVFLKIKDIKADPFVQLSFEDVVVHTNLIGSYNASNIAVAATIGNYFGIENSAIKDALESYIPTNNRSQIIEKDSKKILLDAYNANPSSMEAALHNLFKLSEPNKIAILGDMFELGEESETEHQKVIAFCASNDLIQFYFIGKHFFKAKIDAANMKFFKDFEDFSAVFSNENHQERFLLIKGSRGMSLERTLDIL